ncbi:hypothetical protein [Sphingomonas sp.]|uniref:hypothetical protein n=1 Tax=Sphingomonas sp. TaxID=28214 RepID=UPI001B2EDB25|nr:hypothetical protein [Sphingomonas sp.]MBO9711481.1 hypothetical protein [Sphingomonas sp.]
MAALPPQIERILAFLGAIGISVSIEPVDESSLLPGATIRSGGLIFDPALPYPGDLLHEAGHIAVTDPALRPTLGEIPSDPAEEMAAIAWSYAAALAAGIEPALVLHDQGYQGGGGYLVEAMAGALPPGVPMLQLWGMTAARGQAKALGLPAYPAMARWLR